MLPACAAPRMGIVAQPWPSRTAAERSFSAIKDTATASIARGWCRQMGLTPLMLWITCLLAVRNQRILTAWDTRQADRAPLRRRRAPALHPAPRRRVLGSQTALAPGGEDP